MKRSMRAAVGLLALGLAPWGWAESIDTSALEQPWPKQWVHDYEVDKYPVQWRQRVSQRDGIFAGASFLAPSDHPRTWELATAYTDLGTMTPGVSAVRILEQTDTRRVIQVDIKVLWKQLTLTFEIEQEPPTAVRFRLIHHVLGEYRGLCRMRPEGAQTHVEMTTSLQPAVRIPGRVVILVQRTVMLRGIRNFLETCSQPAGAPGAPSS